MEIESQEQQQQEHNDVVSLLDCTKSFLGKLISLSQKEKIFMTESRIIGNLFTMFSAGTETSYNVLIVSLYEIAYDTTGLQNELYKEICSLFDNSSSSDNINTNYENNEIIDSRPILNSYY